MYFDGTKVAANAGKESLKPRFYVDAHLNGLLGEAFQSTEQKSLTEERAGGAADEQEERPAPAHLPTSLSAEEQEHLARDNTQRMTGLRNWEPKIVNKPAVGISGLLICK